MAELKLALFVAGSGPRSIGAEASVRELFDRHAAGAYDLEVVDVLEAPKRAEESEIIATPTLVRKDPPPPVRLVGDLSNFERATALLGLRSH